MLGYGTQDREGRLQSYTRIFHHMYVTRGSPVLIPISFSTCDVAHTDTGSAGSSLWSSVLPVVLGAACGWKLNPQVSIREPTTAADLSPMIRFSLNQE